MAYADKKKANEYHAKWEKEFATRLSLKLMNSTDADIIAFLDTVDSKQGVIKAALRYYIANGCPGLDDHDE